MYLCLCLSVCFVMLFVIVCLFELFDCVAACYGIPIAKRKCICLIYCVVTKQTNAQTHKQNSISDVIVSNYKTN